MTSNVDWKLLIEAVANEERMTKTVATYTHHVIQQLSANEVVTPTLRSMARVVHRRLGREGYDRSIGRIEDWYRTALWVANSNGGEVEWLDDRSFSAHQRARRRGWSWLKLVFEFPPVNEQGYESGPRNFKQQLLTVISGMKKSEEMVVTAEKYAHGYERHKIGEINDLIEPFLEEDGPADQIIAILDVL